METNNDNSSDDNNEHANDNDWVEESGEWEIVSSTALDSTVGGQGYSPIPGGRSNQEYVRRSYQRNGAIWGGLAGARGGPRGMWRGARAGYRAGGRTYDRIHGPIQ